MATFESVTRKVHFARTLVASAARTETDTGTTAIRLPDAPNAVGIVLDVTAAATEVGDTLNVFVQTKIDGTNWVDVYHATEVLGNGGAKRYIAKVTGALAEAEFENGAALAAAAVRNYIGDEWRARWVVVDADADNASFTFSIAVIPM